MPLKLAAPIIKTFTLDDSDETYGIEGEEATTIYVKQATQYGHALRQDLFSTLERKYRGLGEGEGLNEVSIVQRIALEELKELEVWLTLVDCNMLDEEGKALFPSKTNKAGEMRLSMTRQQFAKAWGKLFPDVAREMHNKVLEVNPLWVGLEGEGKSQGG